MPTFTAISLESLLEPKTLDSHKASTKSTKSVTNFSNHNNKEVEVLNKTIKPPTRRRVNITPALYTTPEPTPIVDASFDSVSGSPYIVNRKGRGGKSVNCRAEVSTVENEERNRDLDCGGGEKNGGGELQFKEIVDENLLAEGKLVEDDDFVDTRCDSWSIGSCSVGSCGEVKSLSMVSNQGEFFDADDGFSSDGSSSSALYCGRIFESEMRSTWLSLLEEIEKRKAAEDALGLMYYQWLRIGNLLLAQAGLRFPSPPNANSNVQLEIDSVEQFCQEVVVARYVSEAIGKGLACAEAELAAETIIKTKDHEISRLRDRLEYYEAVNHEMSKRNQQVIEAARMKRQKKKILKRWFWSAIGLSIGIGASVIAYSCLPQNSGNESLLTSSSDSSDACCISSSDNLLETNSNN